MKSGTGPSDGDRLVVYEYWPKGIPGLTPMNSQMKDTVAAIAKKMEAVLGLGFCQGWKRCRRAVATRRMLGENFSVPIIVVRGLVRRRAIRSWPCRGRLR